MAEQQEQPSKVQSWAYPFPLKNAPTQAASEDYLAALASADDGFYPLGANGLWHGGIHFGQSTSGKFEQNGGVRCIADGEVVAYRLDSELKELAYPDGNKAGYSSGFTLVRHRLVLPPVPTATPAPATPGSTPPPTTNPQSTNADNPQDVLTFFSLYMHTLVWAGYKADPQQHTAEKMLPAYYGAKQRYVVGTNCTDAQQSSPGHDAAVQPGLRVRSTHSSNGAVLGWLPRGTKVEIATKHGSWGKISHVVEGAPQGYYAGQQPNASASTGWVYLPAMDSEAKPAALDQIYVLPTPHRIAAGELIAYLGEYQRLAEARAHGSLKPALGERPLLHVEVFTGQDINAFITRSQARAQQLPAKDRTLLLISKGAKLALPRAEDSSIDAGISLTATTDSPSDGAWCKVQQVASPAHPHPSSTPVWIKRGDLAGTDARRAWTSFPLSLQSLTGPTAGYQRVVSIASGQHCSDGAGNTWYSAQVADDNDAAAVGWVCDHGHALVELKSMWDWPGFDVLNLTASVSEMFQRALFIADHGAPDELNAFQTSFDGARSDAVFKKLEDAIDGQEQHDGKITAHELQLALSKPWLSDRIDHLIVRYESEWGGAMSKWEALNPQMHGGLPVWQAEMKRIDQLRIWDGVGAALASSSNPSVFHFHPVGLIGNFSSRGVALICSHCGADLTLTSHILTALYPQISTTNAVAYSSSLNKAFKKYDLNTCFRVSHFLGQAFVECTGFTSFAEGLTYSNGERLWNLYHSALVAGLHRLHPDWTETQMRTYTETNLIHNDPGLGKVLFGSAQYPDVDYRGRGPLNLTLEDNYSHYKNASGVDVIANPNQIATDSSVGCDSSAWFWKSNGINEKADINSLTAVTHTVNTPMLNIAGRGNAAKKAFELLNNGINPCADRWHATVTAANGWS